MNTKLTTPDDSTEPIAAPESVSPTLALKVDGVSKRFGAVQALDDVSLTLAPGEIHALVGENGSGKSTLVKVIAGAIAADTGTLTIAGERLVRPSPRASRRMGTHTVFQDGSLIPELSVAQNMYVGSQPEHRPAYGDIDAWTALMLQDAQIAAPHPETRAGAVSPGDQQLIEIVRALHIAPTLVMLDEATSALDPAGVDHALRLVEAAAAAGSAVLFVTHRLSEVFRVANTITVLRDGQWQGTFAAADVNQQQLVELMAGTSVDVEFPERHPIETTAPSAVEARGLQGDRLGPVDIKVRRGEILGVAGADGNGQVEMLKALARINVTDGVVEIGSRTVQNYREAVDAGAIYLTGDRDTSSLLPALSVRENLTVGVLSDLATSGFVTRARERRHAAKEIDRFGVRVGDVEDPVSSLSGGNQQKVAISRVLATEPSVLFIEEPTQGVDVRSRMEIYRFLRTAADEGLAIVLYSSDASELAGLADRVVVMSRGRIVEEIDGPTATEESIIRAFVGATHLLPEATDTVNDEAADTFAEDAGVAPVNTQQRPHAHLRAVNDFSRLSFLVLGLLLMGVYASVQNDTFLTSRSLSNIALLALPLVVAAIAQYCVLLFGGLDIAVAGTIALTVVTLSFAVTSGGLVTVVLLSLIIACGVGLAIGVVNSLLIEVVRISPVIATIATLGASTGLALMLRPTAGGLISRELGTVFKDGPWFLPWPLLFLAVAVMVADYVLWRRGLGLSARAMGLSPINADRLGLPTRRMRVGAYLMCGMLSGVAGVCVAAQVSVGDATVGGNYTLLAIAAPVLGGASLAGGRGSFLGCFVGAVVLALSQILPQTLGISDAMGFLLIGILTLLALLAYSSRRERHRRNRFRSFIRPRGAAV
jgi:ribose transport system ATP-binding protein